MSDNVIIRVEGLGKKYSLRHLRDQRYIALRDVLVEKATGLFRRDGKSRGQNGGNTREDFWALRDINFEVKQGEVVGIIGRNGAGKSTLLKILSRITEPTEGKVHIKGRVASLLEVGTGFHPELTGRENIFLNGAILGMSRAEIRNKFDEIVAFAETEKFLDTPVKRYSSGMYVRLAFAVAAHLEPEILLVDEVLAVGDAEFQKKCLGKMHTVSQKEGRTVFFVSHNLRAVQTLCDSALLLEAGRNKCRDRTEVVLRRYTESIESRPHVQFSPDPTRPTITFVGVDQEALEKGTLIVNVGFKSPYALNPPIAGLVISSLVGTPVFGSNPRFHRDGYGKAKLGEGVVRLQAPGLPIHAGTYKLSVWLGDWENDYDEKLDVLTFDFKSGHRPAHAPDPEAIGYVDIVASWSVVS